MRVALICAALAATFFCGQARAQLVAEPLPGDPNLVVFSYDENNSFRILARPLAATHIVLEPDERVKLLVLGDTVSWQATKKDNNIFLKPVYPNRATSGTLLTTKRSYQLMLISTGEGGRWYQRVSFQFPELAALAEQDADRTQVLIAQGQAELPNRATSQPGMSGSGGLPPPVVEAAARNGFQSEGTESLDPTSLNFKYEISGNAAFRPLTVYDDGRTMYIKLPDATDIPAVFRLKRDEIEMADYTLKNGNVLVIPRVLEAVLLKLGKEEVRIFNLTKVRKGWFGSIEIGGD